MASVDLISTWMQLSEVAQLQAWRSFTSAIDSGDAGYHRFYLLLMPRWVRGEAPVAALANDTLENSGPEAEPRSGWEFGEDASLAGFGEPPF